MGFGGALGLLTVLQTLANVRLSALYNLFLGSVGLVSAIVIVFAISLARARSWAVAAAPYASFVLFFVSGGWLVAGFLGGILTLFGLVTPALAAVGVALSIAARGPLARVVAARTRLRGDGMDLGL